MVNPRHVGVALLALATGCERVPLTPPNVPNAGWLATWDGQPVNVEGVLSMGVDTLSGTVNHWVQWADAQGEVWEVRLHRTAPAPAFDWAPGDWPWTESRPMLSGEVEVDEDPDNVWWLQGEELPAQQSEHLLEWRWDDSLVVAMFDESGSCRQSLVCEWPPRSECQTDLLLEPFDVEESDNQLKLTPPGDHPEAGWVWWVDGQALDTTYGEAHLHLPEANALTVALTPVTPEGVYGEFWMERSLDFGDDDDSWGACQTASFELDLDEAHRGWVEVRRRMNGVLWSTQVPCDDVPEGMWSLEATQMVELGVLANGWEAVEVRLDWELPMKQENSPDGWVSVEAVGMSFPLPVNR